MAKKESLDGARSVNRSQAIRDVFADNPHTDTKAVIARLAEKGIKVSPTMVYYIRSKQRLARRKAKRRRWRSRPGRRGRRTRSNWCSA